MAAYAKSADIRSTEQKQFAANARVRKTAIERAFNAASLENTVIDISKLTDSDVGRNVTYHREFCNREFGKLSSWNDKAVFVRFKGPGGEACEPDDVSFDCNIGPATESKR